MEDSEPLWRRIFLNELLLAGVAALIILYIAFHLATGGQTLDDEGRPIQVDRP